MAKTWTWISGWGIYPNRFRSAVERALPEDVHHVLAPTPDALKTVLESNTDFIGGYSLGSLILLSALQRLPKGATVVCLAPFIAFCKDAQKGGTTPRATLLTLQQRLHKQPQKTLQLFYRLAGLNDTLTTDLPYSIEHLEWGLEQLANLQAGTGSLDRVKAIAGLQDSLIDAKALQSVWPACHFADSCNHDYTKILTAWLRVEFSSNALSL